MTAWAWPVHHVLAFPCKYPPEWPGREAGPMTQRSSGSSRARLTALIGPHPRIRNHALKPLRSSPLLTLIRNCQTAKAPRTPTKWPIQGKIEEISEGPLKGLRVRCWEDGNIVSFATLASWRFNVFLGLGLVWTGYQIQEDSRVKRCRSHRRSCQWHLDC